MITTAQIRYIHVLARQKGLQHDELKDYLQQLSDNRTDSLKELTKGEVSKLIAALSGNDVALLRMKRKVFAQAHEMGWELPDGKVDVGRVNAWAVKHTPYHRSIDELNATELSKVVTLFGRVYLSFMKGL